MKTTLSTIFVLLFLAFSFNTTSEGWKIQQLPVNDFINDIFFIDTLTGWAVTQGRTNTNDTAYILKTTDGGNSWDIQYTRTVNITAVYFVNPMVGFVGGGSGTGIRYVLKTTNSGLNWNEIFFSSGNSPQNLQFLNQDTGWLSDDNLLSGGIFKTTNGGINWTQQLGASSFIGRFHMLNKDTGWAVSKNSSGKLYRTTNGGNNWNIQYNFTSQTNDIFFFNRDCGVITGSANYFSIDGGVNWTPTNEGGVKVSFANDSIGWAGSVFNQNRRTTNGGKTWYRQNVPIFNSSSVSAKDTNNAWAGGSGIIHTTDGGGVLLSVNNNKQNELLPSDYYLDQNYPNPFNPATTISYSLKKSGNVRVTVYDITGKERTELVNENKPAGQYKVKFKGSNYSSGIYFYCLFINNTFVSRMKMMLVK